MENTKTNWKKILIGAFAVVLILALVLVIGIFALWHNEIATVGSMKMVRPANPDHGDGPVYQMEVSGGFYLEEFIAQGGVESDQELIDFITGNITRGLVDMTITEPEIACASFTATAENGDALFARNYDFDETSTCLVFTEGMKTVTPPSPRWICSFWALTRRRASAA